jgi:hypothetical protein
MTATLVGRGEETVRRSYTILPTGTRNGTPIFRNPPVQGHDRGIPPLEPAVPAAKLPPGDLQDIAPEVLGEGLKLLRRQLVIPGGGVSERLLDDREAGFRVVQRLAVQVFAHRRRILGRAGDLLREVVSRCPSRRLSSAPRLLGHGPPPRNSQHAAERDKLPDRLQHLGRFFS